MTIRTPEDARAEARAARQRSYDLRERSGLDRMSAAKLETLLAEAVRRHEAYEPLANPGVRALFMRGAYAHHPIAAEGLPHYLVHGDHVSVEARDLLGLLAERERMRSDDLGREAEGMLWTLDKQKADRVEAYYRRLTTALLALLADRDARIKRLGKLKQRKRRPHDRRRR